ncbi:MAG: hypothetical protein IKU71_07250 [Kiritimatiellae bacterium]|nr:hypothetical protein [Kiritimatiellia bacterium]
MNAPTAKNEMTNLLSALERNGSEGRRIARQFRMYRNRLERDIRQEFGLSEKDINVAFCDLLGVCLAEVMIGTDSEMNDYESFWGDMCAYCKLNYNPDDEEEMCAVADDETLDEVLPFKEKQNLYKMCARAIRGKCLKSGANVWDIEDMASGMYNRLLAKRVGEVFSHGVPAIEAEWMGFLRKDAEFVWMNYYKESWRHPTCSLDELIKAGRGEDGGEEMVDKLNFEEDSFWQPNRKDDFLNSFEAQHELQYVRETCARLGAQYSSQNKKALHRLLFDEADIETVSSELGIKANALYVMKKRFLDALRQKGQAVLSEVEMAAA